MLTFFLVRGPFRKLSEQLVVLAGIIEGTSRVARTRRVTPSLVAKGLRC